MLVKQKGITLIELMVGMVLGLLVTGIAIQMYISTLGITKQTTETVRLNQELRAIADLIITDVRRAGYWSGATTGSTNPYSIMVSDNGGGGTHLQVFDSPAGGSNNCIVVSYENNTPSPSEHIYGYRVSGAVIQMLTVTSYASGSYADCGDPAGYSATGSWVTLSDSRVFSVSPDSLVFTTNSGGTSWASASSKSITVAVKGSAAGDPKISRELLDTVRIRNEY
ncbi:MAG: prepilin-type N-terminal cleavage/methylation domain-containing protein [Gammaproteobacteria bacterium]|nr:prepilin-type N-terminal cleavage/methylation domain-containing protein [Gammaproteobacteria bacterium]